MPKTVPILSASGFGLWVLDADQHFFYRVFGALGVGALEGSKNV